MNIADLVAEAAAQHGRRRAVTEVGDGRRATWAEAEAAVARSAGGLRAAGVGAGDRVALLLPNSLAFAVAYWAVLRAGATAVPMNPAYTPRELADLIDDVGEMEIQRGLKLAILATLTAAQSSIANDDGATACNQLQAAANLVTAQSGKHLSVAEADALLAQIAAIRAELDC